jgi:hypothetical protein
LELSETFFVGIDLLAVIWRLGFVPCPLLPQPFEEAEDHREHDDGHLNGVHLGMQNVWHHEA